jgi:hypothetical protein
MSNSCFFFFPLDALSCVFLVSFIESSGDSTVSSGLILIGLLDWIVHWFSLNLHLLCALFQAELTIRVYSKFSFQSLHGYLWFFFISLLSHFNSLSIESFHLSLLSHFTQRMNT